jgi:prepilin-type processing-associated H-X9-DG protein
MYRGILKVAGISLVALFLLGILLTAVVRWREKANRLRCMDNLRRTGWFAMWSYADPAAAFPGGPTDPNRPQQLDLDAKLDPNRLFPPGTLANPNLPPDHRLSWHIILMPYLGKEQLNAKFDRGRAWDDDANHGAICTLVPEYICPTQYRALPADTPQLTSYIGLAGLGPDAPTLLQTDPRAGFLRYDDATKIGSVQRGFSYTISILETGSNLGPFAAGGPPTVRGLDSATTPYIGYGRPFGGHPEGANAAFADGSVRFQAAGISPHVLEMMATLAVREE